MTDDVFLVSLKKLEIINNANCNGCGLCQSVQQVFQHLKRKENIYVNTACHNNHQILGWMLFDEITTFYACCSNNFDALSTVNDEKHHEIWRILLENQHESRVSNKTYWRKNFLEFLRTSDFFRILDLIHRLNFCSTKSIYNFCTQFAANVENNQVYKFSENSTVVAHLPSGRKFIEKTFEIVNPDPTSDDVKANWKRCLETLAAKLRQNLIGAI